jgi:hypothetical protein
MNDKRMEEPGTNTKVPRDLPEPPYEAEREDALVEVPTDEEAPPEVYPDPDEAGSGRRRGDESDDSGESGPPAEEPLAEEPVPQEQPD